LGKGKTDEHGKEQDAEKNWLMHFERGDFLPNLYLFLLIRGILIF